MRLAAIAATMESLPEAESPHRNTLARLRAGALATAGRGLEIVSAAEATGLSVPVVALGLALRGHDGSLDAGLQHAVRVSIAYLVSPAAPTRAVAEQMLGLAPGDGGPEIGTLAARLLRLIAFLPPRRALLVNDLAEVIRDEVGTNPSQELARRYLGVLFTIFEAAGVGWLKEDAGLFVDGEQIVDAIEWLDANAPLPPPIAAGTARLERDGDSMVVRAGDDVPIELLVPLARLVWPRERDGFVELSVAPRDLAAHGPELRSAIERATGS